MHHPLLLAAALSLLQEPEGALRNDTHLPTTPAAQEALARGDRAYRRYLEASPTAETDRIAALEAWRGALELTAPGDPVRLAGGDDEGAGPFPDPDRTHGRRIEGVACAVLRRLSALATEDRSAWIDRFSPLAKSALAVAGYGVAPLERVERDWPLTRAAAVAGLRLADAHLEAGRPGAARTWLERAERHVEYLPEETALTAALALRSSALAELAPAPAAMGWQHADALRLVRALRLTSGQRLDPGRGKPLLGRGLIPGAAIPSDGSLAIQTPRGLVLLDPMAAQEPLGGIISRQPLADLVNVSTLRPIAAASSGAWPLWPATDGRDLVLVVDRGREGRMVREYGIPAIGNHLLCLRPAEGGQVWMRWHHSDTGLRRGDGTTLTRETALPLPGHLEFQPGPTVHEGVLFVQARSLADPTGEGMERGGDLYLLALSLDDGRLLWSRFLTRANDLRGDLGGRNGAPGGIPTSGMPLAVLDGVVVVGTNVGLLAAFDAVDGRWLWGLRTRRRTVDDRGWPGSRRPLAVDLDVGRCVLCAPFDSDHLYTLPLGPDLGEGLFLLPPHRLGDIVDLVGGRGDEWIWLGRDGRHRALQAERRGEEPRSALYLGEGERFGGPALLSTARVVLASDRAVYLFDRTREDLLLAAVDLPDLGAGRGGVPVPWGDRIFVVGRDTLWILAAD